MDYVRYIDRTRDYYRSQGYEKDYQWAHFDDVPFAKLTKPLSKCRIALVSTSDVTVRSESGNDEQHSDEVLVGNVYSIPTEIPVDKLYSRQEHFDTHATHLDDVNTYFPITRLHEMAESGRIGSVAPRAHGVYTSYSHRRTLEVDGPEVVRRCREDQVDAVVLTPV